MSGCAGIENPAAAGPGAVTSSVQPSGVTGSPGGEPLVGIEPTTYSLRVNCSTPELQWRGAFLHGRAQNVVGKAILSIPAIFEIVSFENQA